MRLQKMLSSKQQDSFLQCDMSQAKEDVAVTFITYLINQLLAESMSSNPQPQQIKKKEFMCKTRIAQPCYRHCRRNRILQKN